MVHFNTEIMLNGSCCVDLLKMLVWQQRYSLMPSYLLNVSKKRHLNISLLLEVIWLSPATSSNSHEFKKPSPRRAQRFVLTDFSNHGFSQVSRAYVTWQSIKQEMAS